jgi:precorrin-6B methylase 2
MGGMSDRSRQQPAHPSPLLFLQTVNAFQRSAALKAAIELDLFTAVGEGKRTPAELAARCAASERGVRILADYLVAVGFLTKAPDGSCALTGDSAAFLDRRSPAYMGGVTEFMLSPQLMGAFDDVAAAVRKGGTVMSPQGTVEDDHPVWVKFARAMVPLMAKAAELTAILVNDDSDRPMRVLDIAAGHGSFGINFARANPNAQVVALDWPAVLEVAEQNARAADVTHRFSTIGGGAFEADFGGQYHVVLLANFLHHFDVPTCEGLLRKVRAALADGGRAVAVEFVPDEDRVTPPDMAMFALTMLATTPGGDAYTFAEYDQMFRNAGFARCELHSLGPGMQRVVIAYR